MSKIPFTVSAKTARLIGRENFANAEGAIIELVKNAYDADATVCVVYIDTAHDYIYIIDNGEGMTERIIKDSWMIIGTDDKENVIKSRKNRVKTGAKGIGRFAMDRLGYKTQLYSKMKNTEGVSWFINWEQFEQPKKTINDIKAELEISTNLNLKMETQLILKDFAKENSFFDNWDENKGTIIRISGLKDGWIGYKLEKEVSENLITENLYRNLENLVPPLENDYFKIHLYHSEFRNLYGEVSSSKIEDYDYKIKINATSDNELKVTIWQNEIDINAIKSFGFFEKTKLAINDPNYSLSAFERGFIEISKNFDELIAINQDILENLKKVGAFEAELFFLKRGGGEETEEEPDQEKIYNYRRVDYKERKKWLDKFGGIKLYRDNVRVRPYGDPKDGAFDWLSLRPRSARSSSLMKGRWKLSDRQVYGITKITRLGNTGLEDKSNREGLKENEAFHLFRLILLAGIDIFEGERTYFFRALNELYLRNNPEIEVKRKEEEIRKKKRKNDKKNHNKNNQNNEDDSSTDTGNDDETDTLLTVIDIERKEKKEVIESQRILQALASTGLLVTSFAHDFENISGNLISRTKKLKRSLEPLIDKKILNNLQEYENPFVKIDQMSREDERLSKWLDFAVSTVKGGKRRKREIFLPKYFEDLEVTWLAQFAERQINFIKPELKDAYLNIFEIDLDSIFVNLFANSIEAFNRKDAGDRRLIKIDYGQTTEDTFIIYEDSGPGLEKTISDPYQIFDMFFSTRRDPRTGEQTGTGLGMYILRNAIETYSGSIEILEFKTKFKLRITFPIKKNEDV